MKVIALINNFQAVDRIIGHIKLTFVADKPPSSNAAFREYLMTAETSAEYFS